MINIKKRPFYLSDESAAWVEETYNAMTLDERIGQLFCPVVFTDKSDELREFVKTKYVGGVLYREGNAETIRNNHKVLQDESKIPLLIASNLETGGNGSALEGTYFGRQMLVAATRNINRAYQLGKVSCKEGAAVGVNWPFAPVVDIDNNFRNPIMNVRTFGNDVQTVIDMSSEYIRAAKEENMVTCAKHFPGDGMDERDQHLLTSINSCTVDEWMDSYGKIYKHLIDNDILTIMSGHIAFPAFEEKYSGKKIEEIIPATLSKNLLNGLLREKLGFNGMICSDATPMVGFCSAMDRKTAVPMTIENGCDMFLFNKNIDEDYRYMHEGYKNGLLSEERLKDANYRILATKASIGLDKGIVKNAYEDTTVLKCRQHEEWAISCADEGVTLVKDTCNLLPISSKEHKRVLLEILGDFPSNERVEKQYTELLKKEGFEVTIYVPEDFSRPLDTVEEFKSKYDLVLYVANTETASNLTTARIKWFTFFGMGNNMPWFVKETPTIFISIGNPYHLLDVPMIKTFINGYCNSPYVIKATIDKMIGRSDFKGNSPIDPFCGRKDTKL